LLSTLRSLFGFYFSSKGRVSPRDYWLKWRLPLLIWFFAFLLSMMLKLPIYEWLMRAGMLFLVVQTALGFPVEKKRDRDAGRPANTQDRTYFAQLKGVALAVGGFLLMPVGPMSGWGDLGWLTVIAGALMLLYGLTLSLKSQIGREVELSAPSWGPEHWGDDDPPPPSEPPPAPPAPPSSSGQPPTSQTARRSGMVERAQPVFGRKH
jgi:uncharacterized membrane protein YhaH (DUF805 family)